MVRRMPNDALWWLSLGAIVVALLVIVVSPLIAFGARVQREAGGCRA